MITEGQVNKHLL